RSRIPDAEDADPWTTQSVERQLPRLLPVRGRNEPADIHRARGVPAGAGGVPGPTSGLAQEPARDDYPVKSASGRYCFGRMSSIASSGDSSISAVACQPSTISTSDERSPVSAASLIASASSTM